MVYTDTKDGEDMSKNRLNMILYAFMGCLVLTIIILAVKVATKPKTLVTNQASDKREEQSVPVNEGSDVTTPVEDVTDEQEPEPEEPVVTEPEKIRKQMVVLKDPTVNVNVRSKADAGSTKLGQIGKDDQYEYLDGIDTEWIRISYKGSEAFVSAKYVKVIEVEVPAE